MPPVREYSEFEPRLTRFLVAPDKFKGSLTAGEVADAIADGLRASSTVMVETLPLADGGDGSVDAAVASGFAPRRVRARRAAGDIGWTTIAVHGDQAVVEVASTCGLATVTGALDPMGASSYGLGEAITAAVASGAIRVIVGLGGSASTDAGCGMLAALGARFIDAHGEEFTPDGATLADIAGFDASGLAWLHGIEIIGASDVRNPLVGANGTARVFAAQKGAGPNEVERLERGISHVGALMRQQLELNPDAEGTGSAGGIGYAIRMLGGRLVSGAEFFLDLLGFEDSVARADVVITGEGSLDEQTEHGKLVSAVVRAAGSRPVIAVVGRSTLTPAQADALGLRRVHAISEMTDLDTRTDSNLSASMLNGVGRRLALDAPFARLPHYPALTER